MAFHYLTLIVTSYVIPSATRELLESGSVPASGDPRYAPDDVFPRVIEKLPLIELTH